MSDEFKKNDKQSEIDSFLEKFDKISDDFDRSLNKTEQQNKATDDKYDPSQSEGTVKTRLERLSESKTQNLFISLKERIGFAKKGNPAPELDEGSMKKNLNDKKKRYTVNKKQLLKAVLFLFLGLGLIVGGLIISIIVKTEPIEPGNIYSRLAENSILYDDEEVIIDSLLTSDGLRTNISYSDLPQNLVDAFVSIEDKTFWDHNGFNVIRIFGAIKESVFEGEGISGTSTITQQLARNLYLAETKSDRTFERKIVEAYYAVLLENALKKEQILEAYLNTIFLGFGTNGVQAASQAYFSKDVQELSLPECAALASLPQAPDRYALVKRYESEQVTEDDPNIIRRGETYTLVYNDTFIQRKNLVLSFMLDQGKITQAEYDEAMAADLRASINPSEDTANEISSYFADFAIDSVVHDLMEELNLSESEAKQMIYNNGLRIYTTMNSRIQKIAEQEFANNNNFPSVAGLKKDGAGNILNAGGNILLYSYDNYFNEDGTFVLSPDEYQIASDGEMILLSGKRLNFYKTEVQGKTDYSVEFKDMYLVRDNVFYSIKGGVIKIPQEYKSKDKDGNLVISAQFFKDYPGFFRFINEGAALDKKNYMLKQQVVQPQSAMVIFDYKNGGIKAMVGGRNIEGRQLFNRADRPRQPGSAIKPMGVYGPALQSGVDKANSGNLNIASEGNSYGALWTAASVIDDAPLTIQGKLWPKNWYSGYRGLYTMRQSIEQSVNVNAVKVFSEIGVPVSTSFLKKLGVSTLVESGDVNDMNAAALALGGMSRGVSPLEMVAGYGAFANQGYYTKPIAYSKVTNKKGEVILENSAVKTKVMDEGVAFIMTDMLRTTVSNGIAGAASIGSHPVAGKTGTTSDNYDAWFVGYTPSLAASVWIGNDVNIELSQGSVSAAKIWSKIMKQVHVGLPAGSFPAAANVASVPIDIKSGRLASELSSLDPRNTVRNEYFVSGTQPTTSDNVHVAVNMCSDSNYMATPYCYNVVSSVFVKRPYTADPRVGDYAYEMPSYYCNIHNPDLTAYPIDPSTTLNPDNMWDGSEGYPTGGGIIPINPGNNGNSNSNGNGRNGGNGNNNDGSQIPDWLNFLD
ncbi:MAG: transglycosylase domain-containing protein [Eubacteriales bacterium]|nr:transglycosylase domain-containing protein [Eubacteriales bacterium]MDD3199713.1 transglycosylase domain-containing protein [Eubacteriales bacterium]MDD4122370.1 transglycosylase domain-containing protein [Eubacteriales bacterium]MDD4629115.1 transglycosylase domain-containing protein [Eubacteriales bacterium]